MVDISAIMNIITTVVTFVGGMVEQVTPIISKILDKRTPSQPEPTVHANCQPPHCGISPHYCPDYQLSPACLQRKIPVDNSVSRHPTTLSTNINENDNEKKDKSSTSMSPSSIVMLVFIGVIALAIIVFIYIRCKHQTEHTQDYDDRKSSTWTV